MILVSVISGIQLSLCKCMERATWILEQEIMASVRKQEGQQKCMSESFNP